MELMILGASSLQLPAYTKCLEKGISTIACDYYPDAPAKRLASKSSLASTFDLDACYQEALANKVDGIITLGTDQPVYTATVIQERLKLPTFFSVDTALKVTNKKVMKQCFVDHNIPCNHSIVIDKSYDFKNFELKFPVVMKPLDSQGQRGVFKLNSIKEINSNIEESLSFSKCKEVLIEEYYQSDEICVSGYVKDSKMYLLMITDRLTFESGAHIGICYGHEFPSKFNGYYHEIEVLSQKIVTDFKILNGPIYFQMLIGETGLKVNEIACRIGGAYEAYLIPKLCGVDILDYVINYSLGLENNFETLINYDFYTNTKHSMVALFFCRPGIVSEIDVSLLDAYTYSYGINIEKGAKIKQIEDARDRVGYFITIKDSKEELDKAIDLIFANLKILDNNKNLVIRNKQWEKEEL